MDFGAAASDYAKHRKGFPPSFFARLPLEGRILDLGTGTGTLARGYADKGTRAIASDLSLEMLRVTPDLVRVAARAEELPFRSQSFDAITAGHCWHWFDSERAAAEAMRLLVHQGRLVIARFDYPLAPGNPADLAETLILEMNSSWPLAGAPESCARWEPELERAGFKELNELEYFESVTYTHEGWRGRFRACNGVLALRDPRRIAEFDAELQKRLAATVPDPFHLPHRICALVATRP